MISPGVIHSLPQRSKLVLARIAAKLALLILRLNQNWLVPFENIVTDAADRWLTQVGR